MAARTVTENVLRAFSANAGFLVIGAEAADYSAVDAAPTLTDMTEDGHAGKSLKPIGLYVGVAIAALKVTMADGTVVTFTNVPVGWHPIAVSLVWKAGSTAGGGIFFLYGAAPWSG